MQPIHPAILERLRCPACGLPLDDERRLSCPAGHRFAQADGFLDASPGSVDPHTDRTFASFGYEWTAFDEVRPEDEDFFRAYFADVHLDELAPRVGLDAGCGKARFTRYLASHLRAVVALDGSDAVIAAARNLAGAPNAVVVRADLRAAPLAPDSFGFVSCLGVLHHLDDPRAGFEALVRLLAPGGMLVIYLYSRPEARGFRASALAAATVMRRVTVRLPHPVLRVLSAPISAALYAGVVVPGAAGERFGSKALAGLPMAVYRRQPLRSLWLDTFDRLSAPLETRYVWAEVQPWFEEAGLKVEAVSRRSGLTIVARRPGGPA